MILDPGANSHFLKPYLRVLASGVRDMDRTWVEVNYRPSEFSDEDCEIETTTGGNYDDDAGRFSVDLGAEANEFTWTSDTIVFSKRGPVRMQYDFQHFFEGTQEITLELKRIR